MLMPRHAMLFMLSRVAVIYAIFMMPLFHTLFRHASLDAALMPLIRHAPRYFRRRLPPLEAFRFCFRC